MHQTPEGHVFAGEMSRGPMRGSLGVTARAAGAGVPARIEVSIECLAIALEYPGDVDALIESLRRGREILWGKPPGGPS